MKKVIFLAFVLYGTFGFAQIKDKPSAYDQQATQVRLNKSLEKAKPAVFVDGILCLKGINDLEYFSPDDIESITVIKSAENLPDRLKAFKDVVANGVLDIKMKKQYQLNEVIALADINKNNGVFQDTSVYVDGMEVKDSAIKVFKHELKDISIIDVNGNNHVAIYTTPKIDTEIR